MAASVALIPVAFLGAAGALIATNEKLKSSFADAFGQLQKTILPLAMPAIKALQDGLSQVNGWLHLIGPAIKGAFSAAASLVRPMLDVVEHLAGAALPGLTSAMRAMGPLFDGLGKGATLLGSALGQAANMLARIPGLGQIMNQVMGAAGQVLLSFASVIVQVVSADHGQLLIQTLKLIAQVMQLLVPIIQINGVIWLGLVVILRGVVTVLQFLEIGWKAWMQFMQGSGPIWTALGIAWRAFLDGMRIAWTAISAALVVAWNAVWNGMSIAVRAIWTGLQAAWTATVNGLTIAWNAVSGALVVAWNAVWNGMSTAVRVIWAALQVAWQAFVTGLSIAWTAVSGALVTAWNAVWNGLSVAAQAIWNALTVAWNAFVNGLALVWNTVSAALTTAWNAVWNAMSTAAQAIWSAMQAAWNAVCQAFVTAWNAVSGALSAAWNAVWNAMKTAAEAVWNAMQAAWQAFLNALHSIWNTVSSALSAAWSAVWLAMKNGAYAVWDALKAAWQAWGNAMHSIWNTVSSALSAAWSAVWLAMKNGAYAVWDALKSTWSAVLNALRSAWNTAGDALSKAWSTVWNGIKNTAKSIWNGIAGIIGDGVNACITVVNGIIKAWNAVVDAVGLKSLHLGTVGHVSVPKFAGGGIVVPVNYEDGGVTKTFAARNNQLTGGRPIFGDMTGGGALGGYKPGRDTVPAMLSPGEGVLVPEAVRALGGSDWIHWANNEFSGGRGGKSGMFPGSTPAVPMPQFANGGVLGNVQFFGNGGKPVKPVDPNSVGTASSPAAGTSVDSQNAMMGKGSSKSIGELIANALGIAIPGGKDSTLGKIVGGIAHAALGFLGGGAAGTVLGFIGEKAISAGFKILEDFADKGLKGKFGNVGNVMDAGVHKILDGLKQRLIDEDNKAHQNYMAMSVAGAQSVQAWAPVVLQALALAGAPASWLPGILSLMAHESGGNPNAVNGWDSNAAAGHPSMGLMQVIGPTFTAYHQPGTSNNILDPIANIAAAINYIQARYGHVPGSPYASGTPSATPGVHLVGENGPEMVLFGGGEEVKNAKDTAAMMGAGKDPTTAANPIDQQKLAQNAALWKQYMKTIQTTSDTAWKDVSDTANTSWSGMQSSVVPFASGLAKAISDSGNAIISSTKNTWSSATSTSSNAWSSQRAAAVNYNTDLQKTFADTGNAIQTKWATDWTENKDFTQKTWTDQKVQAAQFSTDLQKTYTDMGTEVGTSWKNTLTTATADTTKYWSDTKAQYTQGVTDMQTGLVAPVTTMMDTDLPNAFNASVTAISTGWTNLKTAVREPVAAVVDVVFNQGIVAMWNAIAGTFDAPTLDTFTMPAYASGGPVQGAGTGTSDSITARLSNGEHVWTAAEVSAAGGHGAVAAMRSAAMGGAGVRQMGYNGHFALGGGVTDTTGLVGAPQGGTSATQAAATAGAGGDPISQAAGAALGSIKDISNPFIEAAGQAGKDAIAALMPNDSGYKTLLNNMVDQMVGTVTSYITANDVAPTMGGANDAAAQAWADAQVGKPYALGGNFGVTFDCSQYMSGIARAILGETPAPWFTTFAFSGDTAPAGFERELEAPFMIGITNVGVGHTAGTLNGTNYEATPPAVRSGPSARGYNDPMFQDWYGFRPSIEAAVGAAVTDSNHLAIIDAAMAAAGVPPPDSQAAWESGLNLIITNESGWDPNAINNYDINAQNGVPSQGLAQVIPPTFSAYHVAGTSTNILDPIANVAAAINYIVSVYGSINNVPGVRSVNSGGGYLPYYAGTRGAQSGWHTVGERGPEWVKFRGGEEVLPNGTLPPTQGGNGDINLSIPITVHGNMDHGVYQRVEGELVPKIRRMLNQKRGK
jgi:SLT domain-containing protein